MAKPRGKKNIKEVAAAAGVSVATVSRALQRPEIVTEDTRRRVQEAIRKLGYTPNLQARTLRTSKTGLIIALVPDIANPFFSEVIRGIEQVAHEHRYSILLGDTQNSVAREQTYANLIAARQADGLITLIPHVPKIHVDGRIPIVNACECVKDRNISSVSIDNTQAAQAAVNHLITLGHRHIALIAGPAKSPLTADRRRGYQLALQRAQIPTSDALVAAGDFTVESGMDAVAYLFTNKQKFTAIFCLNDEMAIGAIRALKIRGLDVPNDVSIVGFDDIRFARYADPPLTTVVQPKNELGREAMAMLIELLKDPSTPTRRRVLPAELIIRASTAPPLDRRRRQPHS